MENVYIHETAVVDEGAQVGQGTKIWHFSHLSARCTVGERCIIGQNVFIDNNVKLGAGVKVQNNVSLYNGVIIEDEVFLGPSCVFTNVVNPRAFVERKNEFKQTIVRRGATVGANATIVCGTIIGEYALIGAGSVITKDVASYALVYGNPAVQQGWISRMGYRLQLNETGEAVCPGNGERYALRQNALCLLT
jgi:UDP-2-acetamido-3-amino-2,3-dideoxy-glucuronate N-acetyltransferase